MRQKLRNIFRLGIKEMHGLRRDPLLLGLIIYSFTMSVYVSAKSSPDAINTAAIAIVDEDASQLSKRVSDAFLPPLFAKPQYLQLSEVDEAMDKGRYTFIVIFPPNFQEKVLANNDPEVQVNVDATRMSQAFTGNGYIQRIISKEVEDFVSETTGSKTPDTASIVIRISFMTAGFVGW